MRKTSVKVVWLLNLFVAVMILLGGCASLTSNADPTVIIRHSPWKQRPGTAGAVGPQPVANAADTRFQGIIGQFVVTRADAGAGATDDWIRFDGEGNFRCGSRFHPLAAGPRPPLGKGYQQGFYKFDGNVVHLAFGQGMFSKAPVIDSDTKPGVERLKFNEKIYAFTTEGSFGVHP
jgi:hypothetical protein